jgi:hypothetical protein
LGSVAAISSLPTSCNSPATNAPFENSTGSSSANNSAIVPVATACRLNRIIEKLPAVRNRENRLEIDDVSANFRIADSPTLATACLTDVIGCARA